MHLMSQYMSNQPYRTHSWICMFVYIVHVHMPYRGCAFRMLNEIQILTRYVCVCVCVCGSSPQSSCIPFSFWKETVSVLLEQDRTSPCAIASYIDVVYMDLDRDFLEG